MLTSDYHLIQFFLHTATTYNGNWEDFMRRTAKVFKGHIPDKLLLGLAREGCSDLREICDRYMSDNIRFKERIAEQEIAHCERVKRWQERREKGTCLACRKYCDYKRSEEAHNQQLLQSQKEMENKMLNDYVQKMKLRWDKDLQDIKDKRDRDIEIFCQKMPV